MIDSFPIELVEKIARECVPILFCKVGWAARMARKRVDWRYQHAENIGYRVEFNIFVSVADHNVGVYGDDEMARVRWTKNGLVHSIDDMPAVVYGGDDSAISRIWAKHGLVHRDDGPARETVYRGGYYWYGEHDLCFYQLGSSIWYKNGLRHRDDGPADVSYEYGEITGRTWYRHGEIHRTDGPAYETAHSSIWFIADMEYEWGTPKHNPLLTVMEKKDLLRQRLRYSR